LAPVLGRPLLAYQLERLALVASPVVIVVATTVNRTDDPVATLARAMGCKVFRGSETDVLGRYLGAAAAVDADVIVRVTADCPVIDPEVVDRVVNRFRDGDCDYASNTLERTFPRGLDTEVFSRAALEVAAAEAVDPEEREHVTPFLYRRPARFRLCQVAQQPDLSRHRWTVDTVEDLDLVRNILETLYPVHGSHFRMNDILALLAVNPNWVKINRHVTQKKISSRPIG